MPAAVEIVAQVNLLAQVIPCTATIVTDLELQTGSVVHLIIGIDVRHPEGEEITDTFLHFQFRVLVAAAGNPSCLVRAVVDLGIKQPEIGAFVCGHVLKLMPEDIGIVRDGITARSILMALVIVCMTTSPEIIVTLQFVIQ